MADVSYIITQGVRWMIVREYRHKKKFIQVIVLAQLILVICLVRPHNHNYVTKYSQDSVRVDNYIILFNNTDKTVYNANAPNQDKDYNLDIKSAAKAASKAAARLKHIIVGEDEDNDDDKNINNEGSQELDDDPNAGRGFDDEFVKHPNVKDGSEILLISDLDHLDLPKENKKISKVKDEIEYSYNNNEWVKSPSYSKISLNSHKRETFKFKNYNINDPQKIHLYDDTNQYFTNFGNGTICFTKGTDFTKSQSAGFKECFCSNGYHGPDCGIPAAAWFSRFKKSHKRKNLRRRLVPRRVINGFPVNHEFAMFEARLNELYDIVDVFIITESNYSAHGDHKPLEFYNRLKQGYMDKFQEKLLYIFMGFFPKQGEDNGWVADHYIRFYMGLKGLPLLSGLRNDDLFVLSDADELPTAEIITFLKLYDGYPEPVGFGLRWNVFGFFWKYPPDKSLWNLLIGEKEKLTPVYSAASIGMVREVLLNNTFFIRKVDLWKHNLVKEAAKKYQANGHLLENWTAGTPGHYAGWHCSWCFSPVGLIQKMDSAQENDKPRWGDYPEKKNITYLKSLIAEGRWFDNKLKFLPALPNETMYAPTYILQHPDQYRSLLYPPSNRRNVDKPFMPP
ncbi:unnamed protein product, partial [Meganyctiphanes norvegica]